MSKYPKLYDGDHIDIDTRTEILRFACCDCGLVHDMDIDIHKSGGIRMTIVRKNRHTGQLRRHLYGFLQQHHSGPWKMVEVR